jgi:hypothetical protein
MSSSKSVARPALPMSENFPPPMVSRPVPVVLRRRLELLVVELSSVKVPPFKITAELLTCP